MPDSAPYISKIKLPGDNNTYKIKDAYARELIVGMGSPMHFVGIATVEITDGSTTDPEISGYDFSNVRSGDVITYGNKEFIWNGTAWALFGDLGDLGALAYKSSASGTYDKATSISNAVDIKGTISSVTTPTNTFDSDVQFNTGAGTLSGTVTPAGTVQVLTTGSTGTAYAPAGTVNVDFSNASVTVTGDYNEVDTLNDPSTTKASALTSVTVTGTAANYDKVTTTYTSADETLTFGFTSTAAQVTDPTVTPSSTQFVTGVAQNGFTKKTTALSLNGSASGTQSASLSGTQVRFNFAGSSSNVAVQGSPSVSIDTSRAWTTETPTFSDSGSSVDSTITHTATTITVS